MFSASEKVFGGVLDSCSRTTEGVYCCVLFGSIFTWSVGYKINRRRLPKERSILPLRCAALSVVDGHF